MANYELPEQDRREDDEGPEVEVPGQEVDGSADFIGDATGRSYDEQAERAQAVIDRAHELDKPELEPDDASIAAQAASSTPGPDADDRPI
jgi:hypothetical protein